MAPRRAIAAVSLAVALTACGDRRERAPAPDPDARDRRRAPSPAPTPGRPSTLPVCASPPRRSPPGRRRLPARGPRPTWSGGVSFTDGDGPAEVWLTEVADRDRRAVVLAVRYLTGPIAAWSAR
jgi:hypothetical protein